MLLGGAQWVRLSSALIWTGVGCSFLSCASSESNHGTTIPPGGVCEPGATRRCVGPGACEGGQQCGRDGQWNDCACGGRAPDGGESPDAGAEASVAWKDDPCTYDPSIHYLDTSSCDANCPIDLDQFSCSKASACTGGVPTRVPIGAPGEVRTFGTGGPARCSCVPHKHMMWGVVQDASAGASNYVVRVEPPWSLWVSADKYSLSDSPLLCSEHEYSQCYSGSLNERAVLFVTDADPPPARVIKFLYGTGCP